MKKILNKIGECFFIPFVFIAFIVFCVGMILWLPFDYAKYKRSFYYKKEHKKYTLFAASSINFEIYNEILKNGLPIEFIQNPNEKSLEHGRFVLNNTLIISSTFSFEYDTECRKWNYYDEGDDGESILLSLDEYIECEIEDARKIMGVSFLNDAVVLIDADSIKDLDLAKKESRFLIYKDNREDVLKLFCEKS